MAESRYKKELDDYKARIPEIIKERAEYHGVEVCDEGLVDLFQRLDIPEKHYNKIVAREGWVEYRVYFKSSGGSYRPDDDLSEIEDAIQVALDSLISRGVVFRTVDYEGMDAEESDRGWND